MQTIQFLYRPSPSPLSLLHTQTHTQTHTHTHTEPMKQDGYITALHNLHSFFFSWIQLGFKADLLRGDNLFQKAVKTLVSNS